MSEFGVIKMKTWIMNTFARSWECNDVGDIFLEYFGPFTTKLIAFYLQSIVADHVHPFMLTVYPSSVGFFQQDITPCSLPRSNHLKLVC